jgi:hypothetical protein
LGRGSGWSEEEGGCAWGGGDDEWVSDDACVEAADRDNDKVIAMHVAVFVDDVAGYPHP